jgi:hypothetical protein
MIHNTLKNLILMIAIAAVCSALVQAQTVASLAATGQGIKWYAASAGGTALASTTTVLTGTTYYASQTIDGVESTSRFAVTATVRSCQTDFSYTGAVQTFTAPSSGNYKLEVWGAQGGLAGSYAGGLGGYATGTKTLTAGQVLNIYVGQAGTAPGGGVAWNGGGLGNCCGAGGGGGTDIRIGGTDLSNRVIVAGGGGGGSLDVPIGPGGEGGGDSGGSGTNGTCTGAGGTQSSGNALGVGQSNASGDAAGGGGGYWGGYAGCDSSGGSGGGGSAYTGGVTSGSTTAGLQTGSGRVLITKL